MANKITVTSAGTVANTNVTPDYAQYYSEKSKEWAISNRIVDNIDYSSKYYANESKKQADISTAKTTEVVESGNTAVSNIENARDNAITNVITTGNEQVERVNLAGVDNRTPIFSQSEIGTNEGVYKNVYDMKHSTFDLSKFTVVGTGNGYIDENGIYHSSSTGMNNIISCTNTNVPTSNDWNVAVEWTSTRDILKERYYLISSTPSEAFMSLQLDTKGHIIAIFHLSNTDGSKTDVRPQIDNVPINIGTKYYCIVGRKNNSCYMKLYVNDEYFDEKSINTELPQYNTSASLLLGQYSITYNRPSLINMDLKKMYFNQDGIEVFSGNKTGIDVINDVEIPYTLSKTGSKIVDAVYRDRVIDLYEQEGQAGYYTIDEENKNFTLPMGEIYGMIGQRSLISSTVTETNRVDIYSDKTCLICGNVATAGTINLPIELVNNNYFITLSTSAKTATSFTTTATGDYILIGKVA